MNKFVLRIAGTLLLLIVFGNHLFSQGQSTTQGKDFWLSYGQNYTNSAGGNMLQLRIVAVKKTNVTLTFTLDNTTETLTVDAGQVYTRTFNATEAAKVYSNSTGTSRKSLHIVSNEQISVFAINIYQATTDATNVLPVTNYGKAYHHMTYRTLGNSSGIGDGYTVVAVEDNTLIREKGTVVATLNKGEVYSNYTLTGDKTGILITSDKPIAYFTTNTCVNVPYGNTACDCLFQQQVPVHSWGNNFLVPVTKRGIERVRIVASQDGTTISQTGATIISHPGTGSLSLNAGQFVELEAALTNGGCYITSDKPVAVASFLIGTSDTRLTHKLGDPAMAWVPPIEQTVMNVALAPFAATGTSILKEHHALIVTPTATKGNTTMTIGSGTPQALSGGVWTDNPTSKFSFYSMPLKDEKATYYFENAAGLSVMGYGLGEAESYFYLAASSARQLNPAFYINDIHFEDANGQTYCNGEFRIRGVAQMQLANGSGAITWFIDGVEQTSARDKLEWTIPSLTLNTPHTITMVVKSTYGEVFTLNSVITVVDPKPLKITGNRYICPPATKTVLTTEPGATRYQWYKNGQEVLGATKQEHTITSAEAGKYTVIGYYGTCVSPMSDTTTVVAGCEATLKVAYNGNGHTGGTVPTDPDLYNDNVQVTVKGHGDMTRTGATFIGWSFVKKDLIAKLADQPNNLLKANDKFNIKVDTTLYAIWAIDIKGPNGGGSDGVPDYLQRSITYNGNGNTGGTAPADGKLYKDNEEVTVKGRGDMIRTDATFLGWSAKKTELITKQSDVPADLKVENNKFTILSDTMFYAVWAIDAKGPNGPGGDGVPDYLQKGVTYDGNGHTGGTAPVDGSLYNNNAEVTVKGRGDLARTGAAFLGWSFSKKNLITAQNDVPADLKKENDKFNITAATTLYAVWAVDVKGPNGGGSDGVPDYLQKEVTYNGNGHTGGTVPVDGHLYSNNAEVTVKGRGDLARTGAAFLGWSFGKKDLITAQSAVPADLKKENDKFNITTDTTLYAVWAIDAKGPDGGSDGVPDYLQKGVIYDGNGHTGGTVPVDGNLYNDNAEVAVKGHGDLVRTGAVFLGWSYTQKNLIASQSDVPADLKKENDKFHITTATTFYAVWAVDAKGPDGGSDGVPDYLQKGVTYDGNGHTGGTAPVDGNLYNDNTAVTVKDRGDLVRTNALFLGWSFAQKPLITVKTDEPADLMKAGATFHITATTTLYAVWAKDDNNNGIPDYDEVKIIWHPGFMPKAGGQKTEIVAKGTYALTAKGFALRNYVLIGWSTLRKPVVKTQTEENKIRPLYKVGDSLDIRQNMTLYAVWAIDKNNNGYADYNDNGSNLQTRSAELRRVSIDEEEEAFAETPLVAAVRVWTYGHMLYIESDRDVRADIYTQSGTLYKRIDLSEGLTGEPMSTGLYVVVVDGRRFKVYVK